MCLDDAHTCLKSQQEEGVTLTVSAVSFFHAIDHDKHQYICQLRVLDLGRPNAVESSKHHR
jgi:hypothetical protein